MPFLLGALVWLFRGTASIRNISMKRILIALVFLILGSLSTTAQNAREAAVADAMGYVIAGDWTKAARAARPAGQVGQDIVEWHRLRAGNGRFSDYSDFLNRRDDWPGLPLLRKKGERSIPRGANADRVLAFFDGNAAQTGVGALRLAAALNDKGRSDDADAVLVTAWRELSMGKDEHEAFLSRHGSVLKDHHRARADMLLWRGLTSEADRMADQLGTGYTALVAARIGLIKRQKGVNELIDKVPASLADDPGLAHDRFKWRVAKGLDAGAIELLVSQSGSAEMLGQPESWGHHRRRLARQMMRDGRAKLAYQLAANHFVTEGDHFIDLEWLAGFIALRGLEDPAKALEHFRHFRAGVQTPISLGRAGYWEGRALEALGKGEEARAAYAFGAEFQTSFYGQLAAEKAGLPMDARLTGRETYPDIRTGPHGDSTVLAAALLFHGAEYPLLFTRFTRHLAEVLSDEEKGGLAQLALDLDEPYAAVYVAKYAAKSGLVLHGPYFPVTDILNRDMEVPQELVLAIVRRESEFYPASVSGVGARGLMQLMPKTGAAMAKRLGLRFSLERLIDEPAFNARLGSAYLADLINNEVGRYYPFVAAGYNAGPSRPRKWTRLYGDPRRSVEAAVDWIEYIPFRETRNYVMRVMESMAVYRARLSGEVSELRLTQDLLGK